MLRSEDFAAVSETAPCLEAAPGPPRRVSGRALGAAALATCLGLLGAAALAPRASIASADPHAVAELASSGGAVATAKQDAQDFIVGAIPKYADPAAHLGTPPLPPGPRQWSKKQMPGCPGKSCNGGHLCCDESAVCCGTSCCPHGSTCCNAGLGLCCAPGSMCCWRKFCCADGFACGQTREYSDGLRFDLLQQCGGGPSFRRLSEQLAYRTRLRQLVGNETDLHRVFEA